MPVVVTDRTSESGALVRTLTLSRPHRRNALEPEHLNALEEAVVAAGDDERVRAVVIAGDGQAFCAGYDLSVPFPDDAPDGLVVRVMSAVRNCPRPTVARVQGPAFGAGLELAISCDVRIASSQASFCLPPAKLGIAYAPGGLARLTSLVDTSKARLMAFTARVVNADLALRWGLIDELVSPLELDEAVRGMADAMANAAPLAVRAMKKTLNRLETSLSEEAFAEAEQDRLACYRSDDTAIGLQAFLEKRTPRFTGR